MSRSRIRNAYAKGLHNVQEKGVRLSQPAPVHTKKIKDPLRFRSKRAPKETIKLIIRHCKKKWMPKAGISGPIQEHGADFWNDVSCDWLTTPEAADRVLYRLRFVGYSGTINDLWRSVYGNTKDVVIEEHHAFIKLRKAEKAEAARQIRKPFTVGSGQTKKPGSHRS